MTIMTNQKRKLFILDTSGFIFRAYHALPEMTNSLGEGTQVLFGFIRSLNKLLKDHNPHFLVSVFDGPNNKQSRREIYADYKSNRKKKFEDMPAQIAKVKEYSELLGLPQVEMNGVEADDVIATIANQAVENGFSVHICTADKDLLQLVSEDIEVLNPWKNYSPIGPKEVEEIYGVIPQAIPDYLALVGDSSDNIPGVAGCGPKKASALLKQFGSVENILRNIDHIPDYGKMVVNQTDVLILSKRLAVLDHNVMSFDCSNAFIFSLNQVDTEALDTFYIAQGFRTLAKKKPLKQQVFSSTIVIQDSDQLETILASLKNKEIAFTTAFLGAHLASLQLQGIAFTYDGKDVYYIDINTHPHFIDRLKCFFFNEARFYGYHIKRNLHALASAGITLGSVSVDLALAEHLINAGARESFQSTLTKYGFEEAAGIFNQDWSKDRLPFDQLPASHVSFFGDFVHFVALIKDAILESLKEKKLDQIFIDLEMPLEKILFEIERAGIFLDKHALQTYEKELEDSLSAITYQIYEIAGEEFNIKSPKQLSVILFEKLQLKSPTKKRSTKADVLESLVSEHEIIEYILKYRSLDKLLSTYVKALPKQIDPYTLRIHPTFNQTGTITGRLSCQDPNLQNIPIRSAEGILIRKAFMPQKIGYSFLAADYSQIELRFLAHFSKDEVLIKAFLMGEDIHQYTASQIFQVPLENVTKKQRMQAKTVNFGIVYGQQAYGLSKILKISLEEAKHLIDAYFERYPKLASFIEETIDTASKELKVKTLLGRERIIDNWGDVYGARASSGRLAVNTKLQGSAAELIKLAMLKISEGLRKNNLKSSIVLQIHDELLLECPDEECDLVSEIVKSSMESAMELDIPLETNILIGKNWAEC